MFAFGDDLHPLPESVELMEELVAEFVGEMVRGAAGGVCRVRCRLCRCSGVSLEAVLMRATCRHS